MNIVEEIFINSIDEIYNSSETESVEAIDIENSIVPPYFIVRNISFEQELSYFIEERGIPVYFIKESGVKMLGNMNPSLDVVLRAKFLETGLSFINKDGNELNLDSPENLQYFILISPEIIMSFLEIS